MARDKERSSPNLDEEQAEGERDTVDEALEQSERPQTSPRVDVPASEQQGITNRPRGEEDAEQRELPPRGEAKKPTPGGHA